MHTQETVDHTLLRVAVCNITVISRLSVACETFRSKERVITNRVAYLLYTGLMPQRQAIAMIIKHCSKPQLFNAFTPYNIFLLVQWSEDVIKADLFFGRSWVRFRVPPLGFKHNCT